MTTNTGTEIVQRAYEEAGLCSLGQSISSDQQTRGLSRLNDLRRLWVTQGIKLWLEQDITIPLVEGQASYALGPGGDVVMNKPLQTSQAYYLDSLGNKTSLVLASKQEYTDLSNTNQSGALSLYYPDKQATQMVVYFWNTPDAQAATGEAHVIARVQPADVAALGDSTIFPQEWAIALAWGLADELTTGQPQEVQQRCTSRAADYRAALEAFEVEDAAVRLSVNMGAYSAPSRFRR